MTDSDFAILEQWLNRGEGALLSAMEVEAAMGSEEAQRALVRDLRTRRERENLNLKR